MKIDALIDQLRTQLQGDALAQLEDAARVIRDESGTPRAIVATAHVRALCRQYKRNEFLAGFMADFEEETQPINEYARAYFNK